jgi:transaldolase
MKFFIDTANPGEIQKACEMGVIDGVTTNPTLISKENKDFESLIHEICRIIHGLPISLEVLSLKSEGMIEEARKLTKIGENIVVKIPMSIEGLKAIKLLVSEGIKTNTTLVFSPTQALMAAKAGTTYVSPFIGRLDDKGKNGMDLISNVLKMYGKADGHVKVLTASVRNINHLLYALKLGSDIITVPFKVLKEWAGRGLPVPGNEYIYDSDSLNAIRYMELDLTRGWQGYNIRHELTDKGIELFSKDWNSLIG